MSALLREVFDGAMHQRRSLVANKDFVQYLLADVLGRLPAERVFSRLAKRLAPFFEHVPESALAGTVSKKSFVILQFDVKTVDFHRGKLRGTMSGYAGRRDLLVGHPDPSSQAQGRPA